VNREQKAASVAELQDRFSRASVTLVTANRGLTVAQATNLRRVLRAAGGELKVAKHTLAKRALSTTRYAGIEEFLRGAKNLVFGYEDPVAVTKVLVDFAAQNDKLEIEGGAVEGQVVRGEQVKALATMPDRRSLQARVVRQAISPGTRLVASVRSPGSCIVGAIAALVKRLEEGETAS